jgi:hypothetical protein
LKTPALLKKIVASANSIESTSPLSGIGRGIQYQRCNPDRSKLVLLHYKKTFKRIEEFQEIPQAMESMKETRNRGTLQAAA